VLPSSLVALGTRTLLPLGLYLVLDAQPSVIPFPYVMQVMTLLYTYDQGRTSIQPDSHRNPGVAQTGNLSIMLKPVKMLSPHASATKVRVSIVIQTAAPAQPFSLQTKTSSVPLQLNLALRRRQIILCQVLVPSPTSNAQERQITNSPPPSSSPAPWARAWP